jgi:hypothetical protein
MEISPEPLLHVRGMTTMTTCLTPREPLFNARQLGVTFLLWHGKINHLQHCVTLIASPAPSGGRGFPIPADVPMLIRQSAHLGKGLRHPGQLDTYEKEKNDTQEIIHYRTFDLCVRPPPYIKCRLRLELEIEEIDLPQKLQLT